MLTVSQSSAPGTTLVSMGTGQRLEFVTQPTKTHWVKGLGGPEWVDKKLNENATVAQYNRVVP
jgi:hypothetical protein